MKWPPLTIAQCDERLLACTDAYHQAIDDGDELTADAMHDTLDELLDARSHIPVQQRGDR